MYANALKDPETLVSIADLEGSRFEDLLYGASDGFNRRFGGDIPHELSNSELQGEDWDEDSLDAKYPKLAAWIKVMNEKRNLLAAEGDQLETLFGAYFHQDWDLARS